ncbi:MAG: hypothetical protein N2314_04015 [Brevinematales bacterium]|nr:hypothetical protein [Brevinematales bacterium]
MIERLFYDPDIQSPQIENIASRLGLFPHKATKDELIAYVKSLPLEEKFRWGKSTLFLSRQKGRFLKKCPGSPGVVCCNYYTVNTVTGCPFDCTYCILQNYIENNPFITAFLNREDLIPEIASHLHTHSHLRVGTGELADSLALDKILEESLFFLAMIHDHHWHKNITIEFKTKSSEIETLLEAHKHYPEVDVVVGFSVNLPSFTEKEEGNTAPLEKRLLAMQTLQKHGIPLALHFDPLIMLPDLLSEYQRLAQMLFSTLDHRLIRWISLGGYRHTLSLAPIIEKRFPRSLLLAGEMFPSEDDHKFRYFRPLRRQFYHSMLATIEKIFPGAPIYLCMEKQFLWENLSLPKDRCAECF